MLAQGFDPKKIAVVANSLGGYYAPRCAARDPRFAACVAWGAIWNYHATWKKRIDAAFNASMSVPGHHITWILGVETVEQLEQLKALGCEYGQGYLFSPPVEHAEAEALMLRGLTPGWSEQPTRITP